MSNELQNKPMEEVSREALELYKTGEFKSQGAIVRHLLEIYPHINKERLRLNLLRRVQRYKLKENHPSLTTECEAVGLPIENVSNYWYKGKQYSVHVKGDKQKTYEEIRDEVIASMQEYSPVYPEIIRSNNGVNSDGHLLVVDPADIHIGKLATAYETGDAYNVEIATKRVLDGVSGIINKANGFNIDQILFIAGNDILHTDSAKRTTTSGTPQDTDGMFYENFLCAKKLYIEVIELLMQVADIHFVFNPSNHDYQSGFFLADVIQSWFRLSKNITFDCSIAHRKYYKYGSNLIGSTHGDGAKPQDLPMLMAVEAKDMWADTNHKYVYSHHLHHKVSKDFIGVTVESLRSPSGTDSWHHKQGYQHATKAVEGFIHHKEFGQVARLSHIF
jgi:hypothetical protein